MPHRPPKLNIQAILSSPPSSAHPTSTIQQQHPRTLAFVVSGSAPQSTVDTLCLSWRERGFGGDKTVQLASLVYELASSGETADGSANEFQVGKDAHENLPIGIITPLAASLAAKTGGPPALPEPSKNQVPAHLSLNYSLPTIRSEADLADVDTWVETLKFAREKKYSLEVALSTSDGSRAAEDEVGKVRDKVEEILGKAHSDQVARQGDAEHGEQDIQVGAANELGGPIVFDSFASPPLHINSTSLSRSQELQDWATFIGRLALHPQTYIKLSPLAFPSSLGNPLITPSSSRAADHSSSVVHTATEFLSSTSTALQNQLLLPQREKKEELQARVRMFLEILVEAFGVERILWTCHLTSSVSTLTDMGNVDGGKEESAIREWYDCVRCALVGMGLGRQGELDLIFAANASKVYRI